MGCLSTFKDVPGRAKSDGEFSRSASTVPLATILLIYKSPRLTIRNSLRLRQSLLRRSLARAVPKHNLTLIKSKAPRFVMVLRDSQSNDQHTSWHHPAVSTGGLGGNRTGHAACEKPPAPPPSPFLAKSGLPIPLPEVSQLFRTGNTALERMKIII